MNDSLSVSPALLAAQAELNKRRIAEFAKASSKATTTPDHVMPMKTGIQIPAQAGMTGYGERPLDLSCLPKGDLPPHLGWHSARVTAILRSSAPSPDTSLLANGLLWLRQAQPAHPELVEGSPVNPNVEFPNKTYSPVVQGDGGELTPLPDPLPETIKVFGHVLDGFHRQGDDSLGRVWLLLRVSDGRGEGRVPVALVRDEMTGGKKGNGRLHCFSWRRLRQLLQQGENRFWHRDKR